MWAGSNVVSVAEHVVMMILTLVRNYIPAYKQVCLPLTLAPTLPPLVHVVMTILTLVPKSIHSYKQVCQHRHPLPPFLLRLFPSVPLFLPLP
jgi:hypothetical protein